MSEIPKEMMEAWREIDHYGILTSDSDDSRQVDQICDLAVLLLAELMESEFEREHRLFYYLSWGKEKSYCPVCGAINNSDPRHIWTKEQWKEAAKAKLEGG